MSIDIRVVCRRDPAVLAKALFRSCPIATIAVGSARVVEISCNAGSGALALDYALLVAGAFDGSVEIDGEVVGGAGTMDLAELEHRWRQLDAKSEAALARANADRDAERARRESIDRLGAFEQQFMAAMANHGDVPVLDAIGLALADIKRDDPT